MDPKANKIEWFEGWPSPGTILEAKINTAISHGGGGYWVVATAGDKMIGPTGGYIMSVTVATEDTGGHEYPAIHAIFGVTDLRPYDEDNNALAVDF